MRASHRLPLTWYVLAAGTILAASALGLWAWRFDRRLESELVRGARAQSEVLARDFGEEFQEQHRAASDAIFGDLALLGTWPHGVMDSVLTRAQHREACRCGPAYHARGAFFWSSLDPERLHTRGLPLDAVEPLRQEIAARASQLPSIESAVLLIKSDAAGRARFGLGIFQRLPDGTRRALGFEGDEERPWSGFIEPIIEKVGRARLGPRHADLASWRIVRPNGDTLFAAGRFDGTRPMVRHRFWRRQFVADSVGQHLSFLSEAPRQRPPTVAGTMATDPRTTPWLVIAQVSPSAMATVLYGSERIGLAVILALVAIAAALAAAMIVVARRLVRQVAEREAFATAVAHDLRTPLTQILLHAESLHLGRAAEQTRRDAARVIAREARRLVHLVENALTFVRRKDSPPRLSFTTVDAARVVQDVLAAFEPSIVRAGMRVRADLAPALSVSLDPEAFSQALGNLLENAIRFGPRGQLITVNVVEEGGALLVTVQDEGPGIPAAMRDEVFHPFVRGEASGGTGIGLAVARQLVELMNGRVEVRDPVGGHGARLAMVFPLAAPQASPAATPDPAAPLLSGAPATRE